LGHKQTCAAHKPMSALPPLATLIAYARCAAACKLGLEGISTKLDAPYRSGPSKTWIKVKNPKSPATTRAADGTF
jgi:hypothetical protein